MSIPHRQQVSQVLHWRKSSPRLVTWRLLFSLLVGVLALASYIPFSVSAQESPGVTIQARAGFDGRARVGYWVPVIVDLENQGASDIQGELLASGPEAYGPSFGSTQYIEDVVLPAGGRKRITLHVPMPVGTREIDVRLAADGRLIAEAQAQVTLIAEEDLFVGVIGERAGAYNLLTTLSLSGQRSEVAVAAIPPGDIPHRPELLNAFNLVVLGGPLDAPLTQQSQEALEGWVANGGTLLVPASAEGIDVSAIPDGLLPARAGDTRQLASLDAFERLGGEPLPEGIPVTVVESADVSGDVLTEQDGVPLAVLGRYGAGRVLYLAFDPSAQPFLSWGGMTSMWESLLIRSLPTSALDALSSSSFGGPFGYSAYGASQGMEWLYRAVSDPPFIEVPSVNVLIGLITGYILLVGPVNYLVLNRLRRATLAWATIPALVLVFSVGAYFMALGSKGNDVQANVINVVHWLPGSEWAHINRLAGVFFPGEGDYIVEVPGDVLLSSLVANEYISYRRGPGPPSGSGDSSMSIRRTQDGSVAELRDMGMWTMQSLSAESVERVDERLVADLYIEDRRIKGTVTNGTDMPLSYLWLGTGSGAAALGALLPGGKAAVDVPLIPTSTGRLIDDLSQQIEFSGQPYNSEVEARRWNYLSQAVRGALAGAYERTGGGTQAMLVGWSDDAPVDITVNGVQPSGSALTILVQPVVPGLRGAFNVPGGMLSPRMLNVEIEESGNAVHQLVVSHYNGGHQTAFSEGSMTYQFDLPWQRADIERLAVQVPFDGTAGAASVEGMDVQAYRWDNSTWDTLDLSLVSIQPQLPDVRQVRGGGYSSSFPPPPPLAPMPARMPPGRSSGFGVNSITLAVSADYPYGSHFSRAMEGQIGSDEISPYVSEAGAVRVRLLIGGESGSTGPTTLGMPTLTLKGVADGS